MKKDKNPKPEKKNRRKLRQEFDAARRGLKWKDVRKIGRETLRDLRRPREIFTLVASSFIPGGWVAYALYRVVKYRRGQGPSNDNGGPQNPPPMP